MKIGLSDSNEITSFLSILIVSLARKSYLFLDVLVSNHSFTNVTIFDRNHEAISFASSDIIGLCVEIVGCTSAAETWFPKAVPATKMLKATTLNFKQLLFLALQINFTIQCFNDIKY